MEQLSTSLLALYECAESASLASFAGESLRIIREVVPFNGAIFGAAASTNKGLADSQFCIELAHVEGRDPLILDDYADVSNADPLTQSFTLGLCEPLRLDCQEFYQSRALKNLHGFAKTHDVGNIMLFGESSPTTGPIRWITLYGDRFFSESHARFLKCLWPHLSRAVDINRKTAISRHSETDIHSSYALINSRGFIEYCDSNFLVQMLSEWNHFDGTRVPAQLLQWIGKEACFISGKLKVEIRPLAGLWIISVAKQSKVHLLTAMEFDVARSFASGLSHKEVAKTFHISHHTVRSHIFRTYSKLGVHNKVALSNILIKHS